MLDLLRAELAQARYQAWASFAVEQRYLAWLKVLVARHRDGATPIGDDEVAQVADLRLGIARNGENGGALLAVRRGDGGGREDLPGMDERVADGGA